MARLPAVPTPVSNRFALWGNGFAQALHLCCALALCACSSDPSGQRNEVVVAAGSGAMGAATGGTSGGGTSGTAGSDLLDAGNPDLDGALGNTDGATNADGSTCGAAGCGRFLTDTQGRVDMLFVVDDSGSMREEQASLAMEFPRLLRKLATGDHNEDGVPEYEPVNDLHLGVVSSNRGDNGVGLEKCGGAGDSGKLLHTTLPGLADCDRSFPSFLTYEAGDDPDQVAADFACLAQLGTEGCGFEQQLESALQALWPSSDPTVSFVALNTEDALGRGDRDNAGFLRNDPEGGPATLAIVVVTDEDDCSAFDTHLWTPTIRLPPGDPLESQVALNLRCFNNPDSLYDLDRYYVGYRALHGWTGARVLFAAIVGVPVELVDQDALAQVDWNDTAQREAHYEKILDDPSMQEVPMEGASSPEAQTLTPSCDTEHGKAYPPRRIVSLARKFGPNSLVQSICGDNLGPPIDIIVRTVLQGPE